MPFPYTFPFYFDLPYEAESFIKNFLLMLWNPAKVGCWDDAFWLGIWGALNVSFTKIDGDYAEIEVDGGQTEGYIVKTNLSVAASTYDNLVIGLQGYKIEGSDSNFFVEVQVGFGVTEQWLSAVPVTAAPNVPTIIVVDLTEVTSSTIKAIRLGVAGGAGKKVRYDFFEFMEDTPEFPKNLAALKVLQRENEADSFDLAYIEGASNPFMKGHGIRIITGRGTNIEKIFAGIIEESNLKGGGLREVAGRCFQVKIQTAIKTKSLDNRELSLAVKDVLEEISGISFYRLDTPSPAIYITKDYVDVHISDALDQMASLPSWVWKLGYGHDLRFRAADDAAVLTCSTAIAEGTNLLVGVKKGSDIYELYNKVRAISGLIEYPLDDAWCESLTNWTADSIRGDATINISSSAGNVKVGSYGLYLMIPADNTWAYAKRTLTQVDLTEYTRVVIDFLTGTNFVGTTSLELRFYSAGGGHFYYELIGSNDERSNNTWWHRELDLDEPSWQTSGSPSWTDINEMRIYAVIGKEWSGSIKFDGIHFEADNLERTAEDPSSIVDHDRVYVYKDVKISKPSELQDYADGLLAQMKEAADRIMLPVKGAPDLQRGRKVTATSSTFGLSGTYIIAEAEHLMSRDAGYVVFAILGKGRFSLASGLKASLSRELRLERLGAVSIS